MMAGWENCKQSLKTCYLWSKDSQRGRGGIVCACGLELCVRAKDEEAKYDREAEEQLGDGT